MNKLPRFAILIVYALVLMLIFAAVSRMAKTPQTPSVPYSQVVKLFEDEQVKSFVIKDKTGAKYFALGNNCLKGLDDFLGNNLLREANYCRKVVSGDGRVSHPLCEHP